MPLWPAIASLASLRQSCAVSSVCVASWRAQRHGDVAIELLADQRPPALVVRAHPGDALRMLLRDVFTLAGIDFEIVKLAAVDQTPATAHHGTLEPLARRGDALRIGHDAALRPVGLRVLQQRAQTATMHRRPGVVLNAAELQQGRLDVDVCAELIHITPRRPGRRPASAGTGAHGGRPHIARPSCRACRRCSPRAHGPPRPR